MGKRLYQDHVALMIHPIILAVMLWWTPSMLWMGWACWLSRLDNRTLS